MARVIWKGFLVEVPLKVDWRMCRIQTGGGWRRSCLLTTSEYTQVADGPGSSILVLIRDPPTAGGNTVIGVAEPPCLAGESTGRRETGKEALGDEKSGEGRQDIGAEWRGADLARAAALGPPPTGLALSNPLLVGLSFSNPQGGK